MGTTTGGWKGLQHGIYFISNDPGLGEQVGDGMDITKYSCRLGTNRGQPCGYTKEQILSFTLDPRMVQLPHVKEYQEEAVWQVLEDRCQELIVEDQEKLASCAVVAPRAQTSTAVTKKILGCTKQAKMMAPSASVARKVAVDATRVAEEVSPAKMSILLLYTCTYRQIHYCHTSLTLVTQEVERYKEHACSNPIEMVGNPLGWWKQHGHHFPTLSRLARRFLAISATSCPVERLFSVAGQVDAARRASVSPDTMTLLAFLHEALPLVRKIRASRIVRGALEH